MLNFSAAHIRYEPYPLVVLRPALQPAVYSELCDSYPDLSLFESIRSTTISATSPKSSRKTPTRGSSVKLGHGADFTGG